MPTASPLADEVSEGTGAGRGSAYASFSQDLVLPCEQLVALDHAGRGIEADARILRAQADRFGYDLLLGEDGGLHAGLVAVVAADDEADVVVVALVGFK